MLAHARFAWNSDVNCPSVTRPRILQSLLVDGPGTCQDLAGRLGLDIGVVKACIHRLGERDDVEPVAVLKTAVGNRSVQVFCLTAAMRDSMDERERIAS